MLRNFTNVETLSPEKRQAAKVVYKLTGLKGLLKYLGPVDCPRERWCFFLKGDQVWIAINPTQLESFDGISLDPSGEAVQKKLEDTLWQRS